MGLLEEYQITESLLRIILFLKSEKELNTDYERELMGRLISFRKSQRYRIQELREKEQEEVRQILRDLITTFTVKESEASINQKQCSRIINRKEMQQLRDLWIGGIVTMKQLSTRFSIPLGRVRQILLQSQNNSGSKLTQRALSESSRRKRLKDSLQNIIASGTSQLSLNELSSKVQANTLQRASPSLVRKVLKEELGLSYKKLYHLASRANLLSSKQERQVAAFYFIKLISAGKTIINVDESSLQYTLNFSRSWSSKHRQGFCSQSRRLQNISIIAGLSSDNRAYYTINSGINTSLTVYDFLLKLVEHLDFQCSGWREDHDIMLDNASYHRSAFMRARIDLLGLPVLFLGPYHFKLAPVERFFAIIKKGRKIDQISTQESLLREQGTVQTLRQKKKQQEKMVNLAQQLKTINVAWASKLYRKALLQALKDLILEDL